MYVLQILVCSENCFWKQPTTTKSLVVVVGGHHHNNNKAFLRGDEFINHGMCGYE